MADRRGRSRWQPCRADALFAIASASQELHACAGHVEGATETLLGGARHRDDDEDRRCGPHSCIATGSFCTKVRPRLDEQECRRCREAANGKALRSVFGDFDPQTLMGGKADAGWLGWDGAFVLRRRGRSRRIPAMPDAIGAAARMERAFPGNRSAAEPSMGICRTIDGEGNRLWIATDWDGITFRSSEHARKEDAAKKRRRRTKIAEGAAAAKSTGAAENQDDAILLQRMSGGESAACEDARKSICKGTAAYRAACGGAAIASCAPCAFWGIRSRMRDDLRRAPDRSFESFGRHSNRFTKKECGLKCLSNGWWPREASCYRCDRWMIAAGLQPSILPLGDLRRELAAETIMLRYDASGRKARLTARGGSTQDCAIDGKRLAARIMQNARVRQPVELLMTIPTLRGATRPGYGRVAVTATIEGVEIAFLEALGAWRAMPRKDSDLTGWQRRLRDSQMPDEREIPTATAL